MSTLAAPPLPRPASPPAVVPRAAVSVSIVTTAAALDALRDEWDELFQTSPTAAAPLRFAWVRQWWDTFGGTYGNKGRGLRVLVFRRGRQLAAVLPLYLQPAAGPLGLSRLRFISTGGAEFEETCVEYLDLLHAPGDAADCVTLLSATLRDPPPHLRWDELRLDDLSDHSPLLALAETLTGIGQVQQTSPGVSYLSNLNGGMEPYMLRLTPGTRKKARKFLRDVQGPPLRFEIANTPEQTGEFFDQMVQLHRQRWQREGKTGSFTVRHAAFHRAVAVELTPAGHAFVVRLSENDRPIAFTYGYRVGPQFEAYQMGVTRDPCCIRSPGTAVFLGLAAHLAAAGVTTYDHLRGPNRFKTDYAKEERPILALQVHRNTWRMSVALRAAVLRNGLKGVARKTVNLMRARLCGTPAPVVAPQPPAEEEAS